MDISAISAAPTVAASASKSNNLSMNDFYKLLAAEMQNQDPMSDDSGSGSGSSSSSYISELTTLAQANAVQALTKVTNYSMASGMVGKTVNYTSTSTDITGKETASTKTGEVEAVDFTSDTPRCYIATTKNGVTTGDWVDYTSVTQVYAPDVTDKTASSSTGTAL